MHRSRLVIGYCRRKLYNLKEFGLGFVLKLKISQYIFLLISWYHNKIILIKWKLNYILSSQEDATHGQPWVDQHNRIAQYWLGLYQIGTKDWMVCQYLIIFGTKLWASSSFSLLLLKRWKRYWMFRWRTFCLH